jgi:hypothetical protein
MGVVLFEMFSEPLPPGMARVKAMTSLRSSNVDIITLQQLQVGKVETNVQQRAKLLTLLTKMLTHNTQDRMDVNEILDSDLVRVRVSIHLAYSTFQIPEIELHVETFKTTFTKTLKQPFSRMCNWVRNECPISIT